VATLETFGGEPAILSAAQTGTGDSTNVARRGDRDVWPAGLLQIVSTIGATPTVTVNIQGSADGVAWFNIPYATTAAPTTWVVAALTITTATTAHYILKEEVPWRYLKLALSANTNVTLTATAYL
jgi:hypothetical protein